MTGIDPDPTDIGRKVIRREYIGGPIETGIITSYNDVYVFVRYGSDAYSKATDRSELEFAYTRDK